MTHSLRRLLLCGSIGAGFAASPATSAARPPDASVNRSPATRAAPVTPLARDPALASVEGLARVLRRETLDNGLRVVLDPDPSAPTVAVAVAYGVGSRDEGPGQGGFAHLFEHMMFQGSRHVPKGEQFTLISEHGGSLNGTTSSDRTNFYEVVPANELALALWLESDRMRWLAVTPQNFENQRAVVEEEYRMRVANAAYAPAQIRLEELVYSGFPAYAHPTIGTMSELDQAKFAWVKDFYEQHYAPNDAVLSIAGDFDVDRAMTLVRHYFGPAERKAAPRAALGTPPPPQAHEARVEDVNAKTPGFFYGWHIPANRTPEHYALELAAMILAGDDSSRLHQLLVRRRALAQEVSADTGGHAGPDDFLISVILTDKAKLAPVEAVVERQVDELAHVAPSPAALEREKRRIENAFVFGIQTNLGRATELADFELLYGDARNFPGELAHYLAVTPEEVSRAVEHYLKPGLASLVEVVPADATPPPSASSEQGGAS